MRAAVEQTASCVRRSGCRQDRVMDLLRKIAAPETPISFIRENCGALTVALVDRETASPCEASHMRFPEDALDTRFLKALTISDSHFSPTKLTGTRFTDCRFVRCRFERLEFSKQSPVVADRSMFDTCEIGSLVRTDGLDDAVEMYAPEQIQAALHQIGFKFKDNGDAGVKQRGEARELSGDMRLAQRALRTFLRATGVNESVMNLRLGAQARRFKKEILPRLLAAGVLESAQHAGKGKQRRFRLAVPMQRIDDAMRSSDGRLDRFVGAFKK